jgi:hypothetical protein
MAAGLPQRCCLALPLYRPAPHFCAAPKREFPRRGRARLHGPHQKKRWSRERFRDAPAAVLRLPTCGQQWVQPLRHQLRIPCNED